jgi:hypothetical protein
MMLTRPRFVLFGRMSRDILVFSGKQSGKKYSATVFGEAIHKFGKARQARAGKGMRHLTCLSRHGP